MSGKTDSTGDEDKVEYLPANAFFTPWDQACGLPTKKPRRELAKWPLHSEAMAIDPEDIGYAKQVLREAGVKTEYDQIGRPILRDRQHRKEHAEAMGFYDRNAGYGDPTPKHFNSDYQRR